jgi:AcrR family transcriptional regulator
MVSRTAAARTKRRRRPEAQGQVLLSPWRGRQGALARDLKREAVIRTAARAFNQNGYHNTSLDDIAAALEVTKPTLYYYVKSKEQLLFECILAGIEPIRAAFHDIDDEQRSAHDRLTRVLLRYAEGIASDYGWCMVRSEDLNLSAELHSRVKTLKSEVDQNMRRLLLEGLADGSIARCDPKMTAFALAGALNWIAHWYHDNNGLKPPEIAKAFVAFFDQGLQPRGGT